MESSIHYLERAIQAHHNVLQIVKLPSNFPEDSFKDMIAEGWLIVHMDDMPITTSDKQTNIKHTKRVLQRMKELNLHLKLKKCKFGVSEVDFPELIL